MEIQQTARNSSARSSSSLNRKAWRAFTRWLMHNGFESCQLCGNKKNLTFDHIWPWIRGGGNEMENMAILCKTCNEKKGSRVSEVQLKHCEWPNRNLREKTFIELEIGDHTMYGFVVKLDYIYVDDKDIVIVKFEGDCPMLEISRLLRKDKKFAETHTVSRAFYSKIYMYPGA